MTNLTKTIVALAFVSSTFIGAGVSEAQTRYQRKVRVVEPTVAAHDHDHNHHRAPRLGFTAVDSHCLEVLRVNRNSAADRLGLERGDRIVSINGHKVHTPSDLPDALMDAIDYHDGRVRVVIDNVRARRGEPGARRYVTKTTYLDGHRPHHHHYHD